MDLLALISGSAVPKIAVFLLFFALVALIFEIFYFRRKRAKEPLVVSADSVASNSSAVFSQKPSRMKRNLIILGSLLVLLALPVSLYLVFQPAKVEKKAQVDQTQLLYSCDKVDILRNGVLVEPSAVLVNDTVTFVGYCYGEGSSASTANINRLRFILGKPSGPTGPAVYLAFPAPEKNIANRSYFKASYPNVKVTEAGAYSLQVWPYFGTTALMAEAFTRSFSIDGKDVLLTPTPTPQSVSSSTQNTPPSCSGLSTIPLTGPAPLTVSLTPQGSDTDGRITAFDFVFGDGTKQTVNIATASASSVSIAHVYQNAGSYKATASARDNSGNVSVATASCQTTIAVTNSSSATTSAQLKAQPNKTVSPTPTPVTLPQAGISLPMVGFISAGLLLLTFGLLLAF